MKEKVVLAYSGGLDTSIIIPWLKENYNLDIICVCVDVGQEEDMAFIKEKAIRSGAFKSFVLDCKEEFVKDYVFQGLKAGAIYEGKYLLGTSLARPLMAKKLVEIAHQEGATYICHGCTGKGNDQVRFEVGVASIDPNIKIIAPWRIWDIKSREDAIDYAKSKNIEIAVTKEKIYSVDKNILHTSHEGGDLENPLNEHNSSLYDSILPLEKASDTPEYIEIYFEEGIPKKLNGAELSPLDMLSKLNTIACNHGIGVIDLMENRLVGIKSRGIYETPGGTILFNAIKEIEHLVLDRDTLGYKEIVSHKYSQLIYDGLWFSPLKIALDKFMDEVSKVVTGNVKLKLYKGNVLPAGVSSPNALYYEEISSFGYSSLYDHKDAEGFINLFALPYKIRTLKEQGVI